MSTSYCCVCASDEGILLDIFEDTGKALYENIETCLSVKIKRNDARSTKICYKCAYELESCGKFIVKYKRAKNSKEAGGPLKRGICSLCEETRKKARILEVPTGVSLTNSLRKIGQAFDDNLFKGKIEYLSVCLDCRYNLDVLLDLRSVHRVTLEKLKRSLDKEEEDEGSNLLKTRTRVVSRKTTRVPLPTLNGDDNDESDNDNLQLHMDANMKITEDVPITRKRGRPPKNRSGETTTTRTTTTMITQMITQTTTRTTTMSRVRNCEECGAGVEHGVGMYRYHRTGSTVCRECWLTMDPEKMSKKAGKRRKLGNIGGEAIENGTKLCAVFLKDVLSNPSKYSNVYKTEKDKHGNTTFLITDESSESEEKDGSGGGISMRKRSSRAKSPAKIDAPSQEATKKAIKRSRPALKNEEESFEKAKPATRRKFANEMVTNVVAAAATTTATSNVKTKRKNEAETDQASVASTAIKTRQSTRTSAINSTIKSSHPPMSPETSGYRKKRQIGSLKSRRKSVASSDEKSLTGSEGSANEDVPLQIRRSRKFATKSNSTTRRTRSNSFHGEVVESMRAEAPSLSVLVSRISRMSPSKNAKSDSELEKPYTCSVCQVGYRNKLVGKSHELTHEKQPEVVLRRVVVSEDTTTAAAAQGKVNAAEGAEIDTPDGAKSSKEVEKGEEEEEEEQKEEEKDDDDDDNSEKKNLSGDSLLTRSGEKIESDVELELRVVENENNNDKEEEDDKEKEIENKEKEAVETLADATLSDGERSEENESNENAENENRENDENETRMTTSSRNPEESSNPTISSRDPIDENIESTGGARSLRGSPLEVKESEMETSRRETTNGENESISKSTEIVPAIESVEETSKVNETIRERNLDNRERESSSESDNENSAKIESSEKDAALVEEEEKREENKKSAEDEKSEEAEEEKNAVENEEQEEKEKKKKKKMEDGEEKKNMAEEDEEDPGDERRSDIVDSSKERNAEEPKSSESVPEQKVEKSIGNNVENNVKNNVEDNANDNGVRNNDDNNDDDDYYEDQLPVESARNEITEEQEKIIDVVVEAKIPNEKSKESSAIVTDVLREVFDLASAEVKKRLESRNSEDDKSATPETLENISLEIQNSADMPSLEVPDTADERR